MHHLACCWGWLGARVALTLHQFNTQHLDTHLMEIFPFLKSSNNMFSITFDFSDITGPRADDSQKFSPQFLAFYQCEWFQSWTIKGQDSIRNLLLLDIRQNGSNFYSKCVLASWNMWYVFDRSNKLSVSWCRVGK